MNLFHVKHSPPARPRCAAIPSLCGRGARRRAGPGMSRPRVGFPLSHLLIHCLIGAAMWAGLIALIAGAVSCAVGRPEA